MDADVPASLAVDAGDGTASPDVSLGAPDSPAAETAMAGDAGSDASRAGAADEPVAETGAQHAAVEDENNSTRCAMVGRTRMVRCRTRCLQCAWLQP